jgi:predicted ABC-type ATPase
MKTVTLMMGGPASGKSSALHKNRGRDAANPGWYQGLPVIDCDEIKKTLPGYDPKNPGAVHAESSAAATAVFHVMLDGDQDFVFDGTGSNSDKYVTFAKAAHAKGWMVELFYVECDVETALIRNAKRERTVNEAMLIEKYSMIETSFEIVSGWVDSVVHVDNR